MAFDVKTFRQALAALHAATPVGSDRAAFAGVGPNQARALIDEIKTAVAALSVCAEHLDPTQAPAFVLDPTDPKTTGMLIGRLLEEQPATPFAALCRFYGSGIYAIYYNGDFPAYSAIRQTLIPIYVGKADPDDPRAKTPREQGPRLCARLSEHAKSVRRAINLSIDDFVCRYMVVQSGWQKAAEDYLIHRYQPVWNNEIGVCSGIGKHGDAARKEQSEWDVLHPGRQWATPQTSRSGKTAEKITAAIQEHYENLFKADPERWRPVFNQDWLRSLLAR